MQTLRQALVQAAEQAGDFEYAAWLKTCRTLTRAEMLPRARYYGIVR